MAPLPSPLRLGLGVTVSQGEETKNGGARAGSEGPRIKIQY
jgi:hypothetical protein